MAHYFVVIAGNIGVGKSSLTRSIAERLGWQPFLEAFDENPYLADFYQDMQTWSFHSQVFFLSRRLQHHHALSRHTGHVIQDRSIYEDAEIFARNLDLQGKMSARDYECYCDLYKGIRAFLPAPDLVVYLQASVGLLAERIAQRGRDFERQISIDYLAQINALYNEWVDQWQDSPLLRIAADQVDFVRNERDLTAIIQQIQENLPG
jgi:deoxyadenosine/deoxycytidine kinase